MMTGLSAFPLTPIQDERVHEPSLVRVLQRFAGSGVDEITVLGSTGSYMYLDRFERARVAELAVAHAGDIPVGVGVGALRTSAVLQHVRDAERAGAARLLLAPVSYQPLSDDEVVTLFRTVTESTQLPVVVYDNPRTTRVEFTRALISRVCVLPGVCGLKIAPPPLVPSAARAHIAAIRDVIPEHVSVGVSGDEAAAVALSTGCDTWYSVLAGVLPAVAHRIAAPALAGDSDTARTASQQLDPLWQLFREHGSYRVAAAIAESLGLVPPDSLPRPVLGLRDEHRVRVVAALRRAGVCTDGTRV